MKQTSGRAESYAYCAVHYEGLSVYDTLEGEGRFSTALGAEGGRKRRREGGREEERSRQSGEMKSRLMTVLSLLLPW